MKRFNLFLSAAALALFSMVLSSCGIQGVTEETRDQVKASNAKQDQLLKKTTELSDLTKSLQELTSKLVTGTNHIGDTSDQLRDLTKGLQDLTKTLVTGTNHIGSTSDDLKNETDQVRKLTEQVRTFVESVSVGTDHIVKTSTQLEGETVQVRDLLAQVRDLNQTLIKGMDATNDGVRLQIMTLSIEQMLNPTNTAVLTPPALMLPYAQKFAETAKADEIIQIFYALTSDAKYGENNDDNRAHARLASVRAASAIAAFASDDKVKEILATQVDSRGRYYDSALELGAARYDFIRNYLFDPIVDADKTPTANPASLKMAVHFFQSLKFLSNLKYSPQMVLTVPEVIPSEKSVVGQPPTFSDLTVEIKAGDLQEASKKALRRFNNDLSAADKAKPEVQALLKQLLLP